MTPCACEMIAAAGFDPYERMTMTGQKGRPDEAERRNERARVVAEHWFAAARRRAESPPWTAHSLGLVLAALDGEDDPEHLGVEPGPDYDRLDDLRKKEGSGDDLPQEALPVGWVWEEQPNEGVYVAVTEEPEWADDEWVQFILRGRNEERVARMASQLNADVP